jgi:Domain of Unknown Function (DUF1080)
VIGIHRAYLLRRTLELDHVEVLRLSSAIERRRQAFHAVQVFRTNRVVRRPVHPHLVIRIVGVDWHGQNAEAALTIHVAGNLSEDHVGQRPRLAEAFRLDGLAGENIMRTALCATCGSVGALALLACVVQARSQISQPSAAPAQRRGLQFTEPSPLDFDDHDGYISLFDGKTLDGWDGNPKFWRVEDGAIVGESTPERPSGNSYIVFRRVEAKDFTLKFEIKVEGSGGSGFQYRSRTGLPWLANIPANVTAFNGPVNLNWMMTGPQADFWPSRVYTGQFYSENTPMRILAWRGQVVEGFGNARKRLMGTIGDRDTLGTIVKQNDWNQYTVIARGGTFLHIVNGQLMAVMVDDDPASSNNWSGQFGIEIEATTKVSVRNIWVKKIN